MAVKATDTITLAVAVDVQKVETYYYQTASTGSQPERPTTASPSGWQTTEFAFDSSKAIWSCQKTTLTDGTFFWGLVSKASAYQGSIEAWNKADAAQQTADAAAEAASNAAVTKSDSGKREIVTEDAAELPLLTLTAYGECQQDGTPSPDAPVHIQAVRSRNIADIYFQSGYIDGSTGNIIAADSVRKESTSDFIPVIPGEKLVFQVWVTPTLGSDEYLWMAYTFYNSNKAYYGGGRPSQIVGGNTGLPQYAVYTITVPSGVSYIRISGRMYSDGVAMLERGSVMHDYVPYGHIAAIATGKNLLVSDASQWGKESLGNGSYIQNDNYAQFGPVKTSSGALYKIPVKPSADYVVKASLTSASYSEVYVGVHTLNANLGFIADSGWKLITGDGYHFTTTAATEYIRVTFRTNPYNVTSASDMLSLLASGGLTVQIEQGSTATSYEPYRESVSYIDLKGEELCSLPDGTQDVLAVDASGHVVVKKWTKKIVWDDIVNFSSNSVRVNSSTNANADVVVPAASEMPVLLATHLVPHIWSGATIPGTSFLNPGNGAIGWNFEPGVASTLAELKALYPDAYSIHQLKESKTIDLGYIDMPTTFDGGIVHVDAEIQPVIDASWWTKTGYETGKAHRDSVESAALKSDAVAKTESVYYRSTGTSTPTISEAAPIGTNSNADNAWEYVMPRPKKGRTFYTCEKLTFVDGSIDFTTVRLLDNATYTSKWCSTSDEAFIDGGAIYAHSVTATQIQGNTITANELSVGLNQEIDDAAKTATNYITAIDSNGIKVHAASNPNSNYTAITADGMEVFNGGESVAEFGAETRIGKDGGERFEVEANSLSAYDENGDAYFTVSADGISFGEYSAMTKDDFDEYSQEMSETVVNINDRVTNTENEANANSTRIQSLESYVRIGEGEMSLGKAGSAVTAKLTNSELQFLLAGQDVPVAYIGAEDGVGKLFVTNAVVVNELQFGNWAWYQRPNGNLSVKWMG